MFSTLPTTLIIETVTPACSIALVDAGGTVLAERHETLGRGHAEHLVPMIRDLLDGQIPQAILVDCGPGSFTGLRVGLAAAHGLAIGWRVPVSGYSVTALLASMARRAGAPLVAALQGGHGEIFVQGFAGDPLLPTEDLRSLRPDQAAAVIGAETVIGSGAQALVAARGWGKALDILPRAAAAWGLPEPLRTLPARPVYGRAPDAKPALSGAVGGVEGPIGA